DACSFSASLSLHDALPICRLHLGARVLDRVRAPLQDPGEELAAVLLAAAHVLQQAEDAIALAGLRLRRPAAPQVAGDVGILAGQIGRASCRERVWIAVCAA